MASCASSAATFKQRYFINTTYWLGPESGAPVFLCVGGEGPPLDGGSLDNFIDLLYVSVTLAPLSLATVRPITMNLMFCWAMCVHLCRERASSVGAL